ncbi:MAG: dienelactone hydrolase family protein [Dehalococcoidia bacterium]
MDHDLQPDQDLTLSLHRVSAAPGDEPDSIKVLLHTSRGDITGVLHPVEGGTGAVIFVGGAMGGLDGPADKLYQRLPPMLQQAGATSLRLHYRLPNDFEECVLDVLAGCSFLKGIGASDIVLVGHSFGAAVVVKAAPLHGLVRAVASLSPQLYGTRQVEDLGLPLLLVHGAADSVLESEASEDIYRRARDPKRLVLYGDTGHSLIQARANLTRLLLDWIPARLRQEPMETGRSEEWPDEPGLNPGPPRFP